MEYATTNFDRHIKIEEIKSQLNEERQVNNKNNNNYMVKINKPTTEILKTEIGKNKSNNIPSIGEMLIAAFNKEIVKEYEEINIIREQKAKENNISLNGTVLMENELIPTVSQYHHNVLFDTLGININRGFKYKFTVPVLNTEDLLEWNADGYTKDPQKFYNKYQATPKRLVGVVDLPAELFIRKELDDITYCSDFLSAAKSVLERQILSFDAETKDKSKGILNKLEGVKISSYDDILKLEEKLCDVHNKIYIVHPSTLTKLHKIYNNNNLVVTDGYLNGIKYYTTTNAPKDTIILGDFNKIFVGGCGITSIIMNNVTKMKDGIVELIFETFFGYTTLEDSFAYGYLGEVDPQPKE